MKKIIFATITALAVVGSLAVAPAASAASHTPVTICHKGQTLVVDDNAVAAHLRHGDSLGKCKTGGEDGNGGNGGNDGNGENGNNNHHGTVTLCVNGVTKEVKRDDAEKYLEHGATKGECPVVPAPVVPVVAPDASPLPIMQQYGIPADAVCDPNFTPAWAAWPGAPEGGWGKSYAAWAVDKIGGYVCTRTLVFDNSSHTWVLQK